MIINENQYVPILKWRQGEYQALFRLDESQKDVIIPLLVIPPVEYDFEEECMKKTVQEHMETFPKRFNSKWGKRKALVDFHDSLEQALMDDGEAVISYTFEELRKYKCNAIPVISLARTENFVSRVKQVIADDQKGVAVRVTLQQLMEGNVNFRLDAIFNYVGASYEDIDLIIDLENPDQFEPYPAFSKAIVGLISKISHIKKFRSFAIIATSLKLSAIKKPGGELIRHEWNLYKQLSADLKDIRIPSFGDYAIETPAFSELDMRQIKPSGKIVYAGDNVWYVPKGGAFRGNEAQMKKHCQSIVDSSHWCGEKYSHGDQRIMDTLTGAEGSGNLSTWKQVGVSHHFVKVVEQLSSYHV